eukprot:jgi/Mesen1/49/ME1099643C05689
MCCISCCISFRNSYTKLRSGVSARAGGGMRERAVVVASEKMRRAAEAGEEDGWTLVVGKAGRKKSTDAATGVAVGAVAPAVAQKLHAQKALQAASASAPFDFYRFQHREARRNGACACARARVCACSQDLTCPHARSHPPPRAME